MEANRELVDRLNRTIPVNVASHRNVTAKVKPCPLSGHLAQRVAERYDYLR